MNATVKAQQKPRRVDGLIHYSMYNVHQNQNKIQVYCQAGFHIQGI